MNSKKFTGAKHHAKNAALVPVRAVKAKECQAYLFQLTESQASASPAQNARQRQT
jgi:hypothetical protein